MSFYGSTEVRFLLLQFWQSLNPIMRRAGKQVSPSWMILELEFLVRDNPRLPAS
jgi:hypothetical protein